MSATQSSVQSEIPPGFIDLGVGHPASDLLPVALMRDAARHRFASGNRDFLQYGIEQGAPPLRAQLAALLGRNYRRDGAPLVVSPDSLLITNGISQALELICTLYLRPGDTIVVEDPTYFLALRIFADHDVRVLAVPVDDEGLSVDALAALLETERPKLLYTIPTYQNPSGATLSAERRAALVALAERHNLLIVADEVYHLLGFGDMEIPPLAAWSESPSVISLGSFSKILAPGLRLGWVQAHSTHLQRMVNSGLLDSGGGLNPFTGAMVQSALELGLVDPWIATLRTTYAARSAALTRAVNETLSDALAAPVPAPQGGYFLWIELPSVDTAALLPYAATHRVGYRAGVRFSATGGALNRLRLCHAYYDERELVEGAQRLAAAVHDYVRNG